MKTNKIIYWIATAISALMGLSAGVMYFTNPEVEIGFKHLGFPDYFRVQLGIFKVLGAILLLVPKLPIKVRLVGYIGFGITFISAFIAHTAVDGIHTAIAPLVSLLLLGVSYIYLEKISQ